LHVRALGGSPMEGTIGLVCCEALGGWRLVRGRIMVSNRKKGGWGRWGETIKKHVREVWGEDYRIKRNIQSEKMTKSSGQAEISHTNKGEVKMTDTREVMNV